MTFMRFLCCGAQCCQASDAKGSSAQESNGMGTRREKSRTSSKKKGVPAQKVVDNTFYGPRIFTYKELTEATKDFSADELLGQGTFGRVYRGTLSDGCIVAVKQMAHNLRQGEREFLAEVSIISRTRHRNLVQLQGWCHEKGNLLLVYEYMHNGSLDKLLEDGHDDQNILRWDVRRNILKGVACALSYLHEECQQCVLHRDIKPSNVLLDEKLSPHLSDFGLARLIHHTTSHVQTTVIAGTRGYLAPELLHVGSASTKSDVFSFGVLTLDVATGRTPLNDPRNQAMGIVDVVWRAHEQHNLLSMSDPKLEGAHDPAMMTTLLQMGLLCCHPDPEARPPMSFIREWFIQEVPLPPLPPFKPRVTYAISPAKLALPGPEPKLAIEGPPKALAIEGPKPSSNGHCSNNASSSNGPSTAASPTGSRSPALRSPTPRSSAPTSPEPLSPPHLS